MNSAPATTEAKPVIPAVPPKPVDPPKPVKKAKVPLSERMRQIRVSTTDKLREKADVWEKQAQARGTAEARTEQERELLKNVKDEAKKLGKEVQEKREAARKAEEKIQTTRPDDSALDTFRSDLDLARRELAELISSIDLKGAMGGDRYASELKQRVRDTVEKRESRAARRAAIRNYRESRDITRRGAITWAWQTAWAWAISGGVVLAAYDRFLIVSELAEKMPGFPRATYLANGGAPHTWDFFTGVPYQMRETLQLYVEQGSTVGFFATLLLLALPVAAAEHWRTLVSGKGIRWALRIPLLGYIAGFASFILELGS